ncbi:MAG: hypothetical protein EOO61_16280 [Hymenobacter sp.]|nr:MAG: hypothetical protein EOO61_16280 [Hymenobacter sp.]
MSIFSKRPAQSTELTPSSESQEPAAIEPAPWAMTEENYKGIVKDLAMVISNQTIINDNITRLERKLTTLQEDMTVSINNDHIMERYFKELEEGIRQIKRAVNN